MPPSAPPPTRAAHPAAHLRAARPFPYVGIAGALLVSFGFTFIAMAAAYIEDIAALASAPADLWAAICGIPVENSLTFPLLLLAGSVTMLVGMAILMVDWWRKR
ncbi:MAG: hypothetical protein HC911_09790 [Chloroflexaceae bacterium]|nr:hypothetical protein [Chloroflexaceae bacterium]